MLVGRLRPVRGRAYTLPELLELAQRGNPGLAASAQATASIEAQLSEAQRSWLPSGEFLTLLAPVPEVLCQSDDPTASKHQREARCLSTNIRDFTINFKGMFTRTSCSLVQPLYTFGKIAAGNDAAEQGVAASMTASRARRRRRAERRRAYCGIKLARESSTP